MTQVRQLIDIGANLTSGRFHKDLPDVLARARQSGIIAQLVTGTSLEESQAALTLAKQHEDLYATAGIHPHEAKYFTADSIAELAELAKNYNVRAIGETGLDFNRDFSPRPDQEKAFRAQLALAVELNMPVFLHQRDAHERFFPILKEFNDKLPRVLVHCFTGSREELHDYLDLGCSIGITGWLCDTKRGAPLRHIVPDIPDNRLLIETDAPYLLPHNLEAALGTAPVMKRRNEPAFLPAVLEKLAQCRNQTPDEVAEYCLKNSKQFIGLDHVFPS